jgi:hypothetical protein
LEALVPILVRPVREQLEHDRIIRLLEAKWRRKFKVDANPGDERNAGVKVPAGTLFPDLILTEEGGRKPKALVEVETNESVNHLEAMAQWANLAKSKTSLILFVPVGAVDAARRLAGENAIKLTELWTYMVLGDQVRFTSVVREPGAEPADLIEKVEVFTTERAAPAPRPAPVEPAEPAEPPPTAEPERPRKLAVKSGSRRPVDGVAGLMAAKLAAKAAAKVPATAAPVAAPKAGPPAKTAPPKAAPAKAAVTAPAEPVKPAAPTKAAVPAKAPAPAKAASPAKTAPPVKAAPPAKTAPPVKAVVPAKAAAPVKPAPPAKLGSVKPAEKPAEKLAVKAVAKPVAKKVAAKPEVKRPVAKVAPVKAAATAKKAAPPKAAPRPVARKAMPVRPAARAAASPKKAAPAAKPGASKRK